MFHHRFGNSALVTQSHAILDRNVVVERCGVSSEIGEFRTTTNTLQVKCVAT